MKRRRLQTKVNTTDEIDLTVSQNTIKSENLGENENVDIHDSENEDEATTMATNQQSQFDAPSFSRSMKVRGFDGHDNINKLYMALESVANTIVQSTNALIGGSKTTMETTANSSK